MKTCKRGFEGLKYSFLIMSMIVISGLQSVNAEERSHKHVIPSVIHSGNGQTVTHISLSKENIK
jgi:hypothetical protein